MAVAKLNGNGSGEAAGMKTKIRTKKNLVTKKKSPKMKATRRDG